MDAIQPYLRWGILACGTLVVAAVIAVYASSKTRRSATSRLLLFRYTDGRSVVSSTITIDHTVRTIADLEEVVRLHAPCGMIAKTDSIEFRDRRANWSGHVPYHVLRTLDDIIAVGQHPNALDVVIDD